MWRLLMKLFKKMDTVEHNNWKKGAILGFYTYMLLLFINYIFFLLAKNEPFSTGVTFWTGLLVALGYEFILSLKSKTKVK